MYKQIIIDCALVSKSLSRLKHGLPGAVASEEVASPITAVKDALAGLKQDVLRRCALIRKLTEPAVENKLNQLVAHWIQAAGEELVKVGGAKRRYCG